MDKKWVCEECLFCCSLMAGFYVNGEVPVPTHCPYNETPAWRLLLSDEGAVTPVVNLKEKCMKENQSFSKALEAVKKGYRIQRKGWNGKGMWLSYQKGGYVIANKNDAKDLSIPIGTSLTFLPFLLMKTADNCYVPWLASQTDLLSDDWNIFDK